MIESEHRPTQIRVNLDAIAENFEQVMTNLPPKTEAFAVVKANAYGHGAVAVAKKLSSQAAGFCVSNLDEALELRKAGIEHPILILGVVPVRFLPVAHQLNISVTVASLDWLQDAKDLEADLSGLTVHLKLDTGMGRIGFRKIADLLQAIAILEELEYDIEGVYTHFATADEVDQAHFESQLSVFKEFLDVLPITPRWIHASNSATSIWHADTVFNLVRLGNILYGLNPSGRVLELPFDVQPALSLVSEIVHVKQVEACTTIGYGATYHSTDSEWIATVPIGYADGLVRSLQGLSVLVDGQACEIVGRISMDQITIRLPHAYPLGQKVTLIGQDGDKTISVQEWADRIGTINYEVVCLLTDRLPRIFE
ncbi:alanine racemase [Streptococcus suis]|uniref:alanine racemase n=1 Tax=Streptococcus suis TaxID=1307 RepID=UPI0005CF5E45|nr:alanine racemase [Streptococcus suis]MCE6986815.1 alanine racemase [Streptococcus suis]NQO92318.1 alanine racemase [Streptococcus suis]CYU16594.1 alanine racemase [Streptococcus suis]HEM2762696.1 alanine racemase [Streptococcus suis]HEM5473271.1 alanine racemase [Streptococcus suis]